MLRQTKQMQSIKEIEGLLIENSKFYGYVMGNQY